MNTLDCIVKRGPAAIPAKLRELQPLFELEVTSAIDLTHLRTAVEDDNHQRHEVTIHLHRERSPESNPSRTQPQETAQRTRMRTFSHRVHVYITRARQDGALGWLGGPWRFTYAELDLPGPWSTDRQSRLPDAPAIATDGSHHNHVHISVGTDQP